MNVGKKMEETTRATTCKDKYIPYVLISTVTACEGPQTNGLMGTRKGCYVACSENIGLKLETRIYS